MDPSPRELIVKLMKEKVALKQTVAERTEEGFVLLKRMLRDLFSDLQGKSSGSERTFRWSTRTAAITVSTLRWG